MGLRENVYQYDVIKKIEELLPGCLILKNDPQHIQGIPDLTVLYGAKYALLEVKRGIRDANRPQPNQAYYLRMVVNMGGFAGFIFPEVENEVLDALQQALQPDR